MATQLEALKHQDVDKKEDSALAQEAQAYLSKSAALQVVTELMVDLRMRALAWWTPDGLRTRYPAIERMRWLKDRADLRQHITTSLTGLVPKAARKKDADFQAELLDAAVDDGDVTTKAFEDAFVPRDMAIYGPAGDYWRQFRQRMPWGQDSTAHQELVATLLRAFLTDKSSLGFSRKPVLTSWELRTNIPGKVWHTRIPVDVRVAIDDARFEREKAKSRDPFHAKDDLAIALPDVIAANVPLKDLHRVFDAAERAMGFEPVEAEAGSGSAGSTNGSHGRDSTSTRSSSSDAVPPLPDGATASTPSSSPVLAASAPLPASIAAAPSATTPTNGAGLPPFSFGASGASGFSGFGLQSARAVGGKGPPPLRGSFGVGSSPGLPVAGASAANSTGVDGALSESTVTATDRDRAVKFAGDAVAHSVESETSSDIVQDDTDMLFDVDLAGSDDLLVPPSFEKPGDRPTKV
jgi:hypothetical protein